MKPHAFPKVHFMGICGRAIGSLAIDLHQQGWRVTGMDVHALPPMCDVLRDSGIAFDAGKGPFTVPPDTEVIVTTSLPSDENSGLPAARAAGVPILHLPAFLKKYCLGTSRRLVAAGTNGKTTTTAMLTWILQQQGLDPDYLIAGRCVHFAGMVRMRKAALSVLEGDEYVACEEEGIPKFHYYDPSLLVLTNVAHDHAEVFADAAAVEQEFARLIAHLPPSGRLIAAASPVVDRLSRSAPCPVIRVGWDATCDYRLTTPRGTRQGMAFKINGQPVLLKIYGRMNALNAALALAAAVESGIALPDAAAALARFEGVAERCEILTEGPAFTLVGDNAYHPMALKENLAALRMRFPGRRLIAAFQPRYTGGRGGFLHQGIADAFATADHVILTPLYDYGKFPGGRLNNRILARSLKNAGIPTHVLGKAANLSAFCRRLLQPGDVLFCSIAMFQDDILTALRQLASPTPAA